MHEIFLSILIHLLDSNFPMIVSVVQAAADFFRSQ